MGAIDEAEVSARLRRPSRWVSLRHRLEQYSLEAADAVLLQSPPLVNLFSRAYQLRPGSAVYTPRPRCARSLRSLSAGAPSASEEADCLRQAESLPLPCAHVTLRRPGGGGGGVLPCTTFLVLGKLQRVKSPKVVAEALGIARQLRQPGRSGGLLATSTPCSSGATAFCEEHRRQVSQCLPEGPSPESTGLQSHVCRHRSQSTASQPLCGACLPAAAVLASQFDLQTSAAHELGGAARAILSSSLTLPRIPGFL